MAKRNTNLAHVERDQNLKAERQAKARADDAAIASGMTETRTLGEARGQEYDAPPQKRGEHRKPMRRLTGLVWLHAKNRLTDDQLAAGLRYGHAYQRATAEQSIRSILNRDVTSADGPTLARLIEHAEGTMHARQKLAMYRGMLSNQPGLVSACDRICGEELTPREASANGRTAEGLEAVLRVALDLLNQHVAPSRASEPQDVADAA
jgi:hypothetical protein